MRDVTLTVNGVRHETSVEPRELLVFVLRDLHAKVATKVRVKTAPRLTKVLKMILCLRIRQLLIS